MYVENKRIEKVKNRMDKLPFTVFISLQREEKNVIDYKDVLTEIISNRIEEKYK